MLCRADGGPAVYPRVCGGTYNRVRILHYPSGLSPRVRGNRKQHLGIYP